MADQGDSTLIPPRKQERKRFKPTSRPRPPIPGQEKAEAVLELGEFQEVDTLTLSEASLVINALVTKRRMDRKNVNETEYAMCSFPLSPSLPHSLFCRPSRKP